MSILTHAHRWTTRLSAVALVGCTTALTGAGLLYAQDSFVLRGSQDPFSPGTFPSAEPSPRPAVPSGISDGFDNGAFGRQGPVDADIAAIIGTDGDATDPLANIRANDAADPETTGAVAPLAPLQSGVGAPLDNPYVAPGLRAGNLILRPTLDIGAATSTTTDRSEDPDNPGVIVSETNTGTDLGLVFGLGLEGDYGLTQLTGDITVDVPVSLSGETDESIEANALITLRRELQAGQSVSAAFEYRFESEDPLSANVDAATGGDEAAVAPFPTIDPTTQTFSGALNYTRPVGPVTASVTGSVARTLLGDVELSDGTNVSQADLNATDYRLTLRTGLDTGAVVTPFLEGEIGARRFDEATDVNGIDRNSQFYALRGGIAVDMGEKLTAELAAGYFLEDVADSSLDDLAGLSLSGAVAWSPRRDTDLGLALSTETRPSGDQGSAGSVVYNADFTTAYRARSNLTFDGFVGIEHEDPSGGEEAATTSVNGQIGATYWFNRYIGATGRAGYGQTFSSDETQRSETWSAFIGLRLQR
ncbi:MAG: outer membrane beta-barrel protein [Pseudomonadota bacterium]